MKIFLYPLLVVLSVFTFFLISVISAEVQPSEQNKVFSHIEEHDEGKVVFRYRTDFKSLSNFLHLTENEYFQMREDKSMKEIAEIQGIDTGDLLITWLLSVIRP